MFRVYKAMAVAITAAVGASGALAAGSQDGVIYFTGAIVEAGFRVLPALQATGTARTAVERKSSTT